MKTEYLNKLQKHATKSYTKPLCASLKEMKIDNDGLAYLMAEDHILIGTQENKIYGRKNSLSAWKHFFELFPDYRNNFRTIIITDNLVKIRGFSTCSDNRLNGLSIWTARIKGGKIAEWRVYDDTADNRNQLNM